MAYSSKAGAHGPYLADHRQDKARAQLCQTAANLQRSSSQAFDSIDHSKQTKNIFGQIESKKQSRSAIVIIRAIAKAIDVRATSVAVPTNRVLPFIVLRNAGPMLYPSSIPAIYFLPNVNSSRKGYTTNATKFVHFAWSGRCLDYDITDSAVCSRCEFVSLATKVGDTYKLACLFSCYTLSF